MTTTYGSTRQFATPLTTSPTAITTMHLQGGGRTPVPQLCRAGSCRHRKRRSGPLRGAADFGSRALLPPLPTQSYKEHGSVQRDVGHLSYFRQPWLAEPLKEL